MLLEKVKKSLSVISSQVPNKNVVAAMSISLAAI